MDKIILEGLKFWGRHGVLHEEQVLGQPFIVSLELYLDLSRAGATDSLDLTVNYARVYQVVKDIVEGTCCKLIEALAESIASRVLAEFAVDKLTVRVDKPHAPIAGLFDNVAVEITRGAKHA
ncbi:MAG TPA: dihydroneopterin aldolase [Verrucomicrobiae bacterium]|nr:dihydroneopterin aldolase [Verrucomicrobiae bacterium]